MSINLIIIGGSTGLGGAITKTISKNTKYNIFVLGINQPHETTKNIIFIKCDLLSFGSIKKAILKLNKLAKTIDILIINSSAFFLTKKKIRKIYERSFLINFLSQYILIKKLYYNLIRSKIRKIIIISSHAIFKAKIDPHDIQSLKNYNFWKSYKNSKKLLLISCLELFKNNKKISYLFFNPGVINSNIGSNIFLIGPLIRMYHLLFGENKAKVAKELKFILFKILYKKKLFEFYNRKKKINLPKKLFTKDYNKIKLLNKKFFVQNFINNF